MFIDAYLAVPVRFLFSRYGMCWWLRASLYFLARPKSMMYTRLPFLPRPLNVRKRTSIEAISRHRVIKVLITRKIDAIFQVNTK